MQRVNESKNMIEEKLSHSTTGHLGKHISIISDKYCAIQTDEVFEEKEIEIQNLYTAEKRTYSVFPGWKEVIAISQTQFAIVYLHQVEIINNETFMQEAVIELPKGNWTPADNGVKLVNVNEWLLIHLDDEKLSQSCFFIIDLKTCERTQQFLPKLAADIDFLRPNACVVAWRSHFGFSICDFDINTNQFSIRPQLYCENQTIEHVFAGEDDCFVVSILNNDDDDIHELEGWRLDSTEAKCEYQSQSFVGDCDILKLPHVLLICNDKSRLFELPFSSWHFQLLREENSLYLRSILPDYRIAVCYGESAAFTYAIWDLESMRLFVKKQEERILKVKESLEPHLATDVVSIVSQYCVSKISFLRSVSVPTLSSSEQCIGVIENRIKR